MPYAPTVTAVRETLHDLVGAGGRVIHWPRVALFAMALLISAFATSLVQSVLSESMPSLFFVGVVSFSNTMLALAALLACRWFRNPWLAALMAPVLYTVGVLPMRIWQLLGVPEEIRTLLAFNFVVYGLLGNLLLFVALHLFAGALRPLVLALAAASAASGIIADVVAIGIRLAREGALSGEAILEPLLLDLGGALVFAGVYWVGTLLPVMSLPERAAAPVAAGHADDLQAAADFRTVRKTLRPAAVGSIIFGLIAVTMGFAALEDNAINALLILLGFFLLGEGIWILAQPTPVGMIVDGFALCLLGAWNLLVTFLNVQAGAGGPRGFAVLGLFQIGLGIQSFRRYQRFAGSAAILPSAEAINRVDQLVAGVINASMQDCADVIEFTAGVHKWKARLSGDLGVFVAGAEQDVVLAGRETTLITPQEVISGKPFKASFQFGSQTHQGMISPEAYQRYEAWRVARAPIFADATRAGQ